MFCSLAILFAILQHRPANTFCPAHVALPRNGIKMMRNGYLINFPHPHLRSLPETETEEQQAEESINDASQWPKMLQQIKNLRYNSLEAPQTWSRAILRPRVYLQKIRQHFKLRRELRRERRIQRRSTRKIGNKGDVGSSGGYWLRDDWREKARYWKEQIELYYSSNTETAGTAAIAAEVGATAAVVTPAEETASVRIRHDPDLRTPLPNNLGPKSPLPHTLLSTPSKTVYIVTTASLPWLTGTAVNPLLRAAYLTTEERVAAGGSVRLMLPWLERERDRKMIYGESNLPLVISKEAQEDFIRNWLAEEAGMEFASRHVLLEWYTAWVNEVENSVYSMGDLTAMINPEIAKNAICILEEPEHLNWYRPPTSNEWTSLFPHVIGIVHTNYFAYALEQPAAVVRAPGMKLLCSWMIRAHCHRVIKLSDGLGVFAEEKEVTDNVHGVREDFINIGRKLRLAGAAGRSELVGDSYDEGIYFLGKQLWSKGIGELMDLLKYAQDTAGLFISCDLFGSGPDRDDMVQRANDMNLNMTWKGGIDHSKVGYTYKIFVNPSSSEVLCTATAEALAMGKYVVIPRHPSNEFFFRFPNCLPYNNREEFVANLFYALTHSPEPMKESLCRTLGWNAAIERLVEAGKVTVEDEELQRAYSTMNMNLPPLIQDESQRSDLIKNLEKSRKYYRLFRNRLRNEIESKSTFLPENLRELLKAELDKKLDIDFDELINNPKLQIQLSPAELDANLLALYRQLGKGEFGDLLRVIGGGGGVGRQTIYMKEEQYKAGEVQSDAIAQISSILRRQLLQ